MAIVFNRFNEGRLAGLFLSALADELSVPALPQNNPTAI